MKRAELSTIGFFGWGATLMAWRTLDLSSSISSIDSSQGSWIIAYFLWGGLAGVFGGLFCVSVFHATGATAALNQNTGAIGEVRAWPGASFVVGLGIVAIVWALVSTAGLVRAGVEIPWPIAYGNGYITALLSTVAVGYAVIMLVRPSQALGTHSP